MIPSNRLTIIRNRYRVRELREFRKWVEVYFERSERDANGAVVDWEGAQAARSQINRMLLRVIQIVRAAGIGGASGSELVTDPGLPVGRVDVLQRTFTARLGDGLDQEIFDLLDMAIGVYESDLGPAFLRSINPLYYAGRLLAFLGRGPRRLFGAMGLGLPRSIDEARLARLEAAASRLADVEDVIDQRFAALQDHQARHRAEEARQLAELAERLDFVERVLTRPQTAKPLAPPPEKGSTTPV
jgi:hypothetical protein